MNRLGPYEVGDELARGAMGVVYRARDPYLDRPLAIKVIRADDLQDPESHERFRREALVLARLRHPGVVGVHSAGVTPQGSPYLVMDLLEGGSLHARLAGGPLPPPEAVQLAREIAEALAYAHGRGVLHRDIKPANVLLDPQGHAILTDFGLAKLVGEERLTQTGDILGTPSYMAPEQIRGERLLGPATDIYALGATLYRMLTGSPPIVAATTAQLFLDVLDTTPRPLSESVGGIDEDLDAILACCLAKEPAGRYLRAQDLADALGAWAETHAGLPAPEQVRLPRAKAGWRGWLRSAALLSLGLLLGLGAGLAGAAPLDRARRDWVDVAELPPELGATYSRGRARYERDDFVGAQEDFLRVTQEEPRCDAAWVGLGGARISQGDEEAGLEDLERATRLDPLNVTAWNRKGKVLRQREEFTKAIEAFRRAIEAEPLAAGLRLSLAVCLRGVGDDASAKLAWEESRRLDPRLGHNAVYEAAYTGLSPKEQIAILDRGRELDPTNEELLLARARARAKAGLLPEAVEAYTDAFRNLVPETVLFEERALAQLQLKRLREGVADFGIALELKPDDPRIRLMRGTALFRFANYSLAYPDLEFVEEHGSPERAARARKFAAPIRESVQKGHYVISRSVQFQSSLEPGSDPIGQLSPGDPVRLVRVESGWAVIDVSSKRGVLRGYVPEQVLSLRVRVPQ